MTAQIEHMEKCEYCGREMKEGDLGFEPSLEDVARYSWNLHEVITGDPSTIPSYTEMQAWCRQQGM